MKKINLNDLVLDYFRELGFDVDSWLHGESIKVDPYSLEQNSFTNFYSVIPGLHKLEIIEQKSQGGYIQFRGIPGFEAKLPIEDPNSLKTAGEILCNLYIWMKNINSECVKGLLNESQGFCSGADI